MIVVDSSAIIAILEQENDGQIFAHAIERAERLLISAVNAYETAIVLRRRRGSQAEVQLWLFLENNGFEIAPFDDAQARHAAAGFGRYGKGVDPKAALNLADCAAYALAKSMSAPLLFKGDDFIHTDVERAR